MGRPPDLFHFGLGFLRREERRMNCLADLNNWSINTLLEACFVTNFLEKCRIANKDNLGAKSIDFEYRALPVSRILVRARVMSTYPI